MRGVRWEGKVGGKGGPSQLTPLRSPSDIVNLYALLLLPCRCGEGEGRVKWERIRGHPRHREVQNPDKFCLDFNGESLKTCSCQDVPSACGFVSKATDLQRKHKI